jgi:Uncharacterized protein conserved in bacteria
MPRLFIISGCNGSGKTTASYTILPEMFQCSQYVNSDEFAKGLSPFHPEEASITAARYLTMKISYLIDKKEDFCVETTLATRTLLSIVKKARERGYHVTILYLWISSPELAIARVNDRVKSGGHFISEETVRRRYRIGLNYFFREYSAVCDKWILADNSNVPFKIVAEGSRDGVTIRDPQVFSRIQKMHSEIERQLIAEKNSKE